TSKAVFTRMQSTFQGRLSSHPRTTKPWGYFCVRETTWISALCRSTGVIGETSSVFPSPSFLILNLTSWSELKFLNTACGSAEVGGRVLPFITLLTIYNNASMSRRFGGPIG